MPLSCVIKMINITKYFLQTFNSTFFITLSSLRVCHTWGFYGSSHCWLLLFSLNKYSLYIHVFSLSSGKLVLEIQDTLRTRTFVIFVIPLIINKYLNDFILNYFVCYIQINYFKAIIILSNNFLLIIFFCQGYYIVNITKIN